MLVSAVSVLGIPLFFQDSSDLYGPMAGNLRIMLIYLCLTEMAVYAYCRLSGQYRAMMLLGVFLLILMVSVECYGFINQVPVDESYRWLFLYLGLSHLGYAALKPSLAQQEI